MALATPSPFPTRSVLPLAGLALLLAAARAVAAPAVALARLREQDWDALLPRLTVWAGRLHRRYLADRPGAPEPQDLVQDAIADLATGTRTLPDDVPVASLPDAS